MRPTMLTSLVFFGAAFLASTLSVPSIVAEERQQSTGADTADLTRTKSTDADIEEDGATRSNPHYSKKLDPNRITCPVLAAMYNGGDLHPDEYGSITLEDMHDGMIATGSDEYTASFFAVGVIVYDKANKETQLHRERCYPGTPCFGTKMFKNKGKVTPETERYLNIFTMNGVQTVEHGFSTGVRGGWNNPPEWTPTNSCGGTYPCEDQYKTFFEPCADSKGRFFREQILCVVCRAQAMGDRGGEWSFNHYSKHTNWQMSVATLSMLAGYGRLPTPDADPYGPDTHFTMEDMRKLMIDGVYPDGWQKRDWSNSSMIKYLTETDLPCIGNDKYGDYAPWWANGTEKTQGVNGADPSFHSSCPSNTGVPCFPVFGQVYPEGCPQGSTCIASGYCVCGRGSNGISMCANDQHQCVEREDKCTYFGEPCTNIVADNPASPW